MATGICPWCGKKVDKFIMFRGDVVGCRFCGIHTKQTNADRIRSMTDEELAVLLSNTDGDFPPNCQNGVSVKLCKAAWLEWLKQECDSK